MGQEGFWEFQSKTVAPYQGPLRRVSPVCEPTPKVSLDPSLA